MTDQVVVIDGATYSATPDIVVLLLSDGNQREVTMQEAKTLMAGREWLLEKWLKDSHFGEP